MITKLSGDSRTLTQVHIPVWHGYHDEMKTGVYHSARTFQYAVHIVNQVRSTCAEIEKQMNKDHEEALSQVKTAAEEQVRDRDATIAQFKHEANEFVAEFGTPNEIKLRDEKLNSQSTKLSELQRKLGDISTQYQYSHTSQLNSDQRTQLQNATNELKRTKDTLEKERAQVSQEYEKYQQRRQNLQHPQYQQNLQNLQYQQNVQHPQYQYEQDPTPMDISSS